MCRKQFLLRSCLWPYADWINDKRTCLQWALYDMASNIFTSLYVQDRMMLHLLAFHITPKNNNIFCTYFQVVPGLLGLLGNLWDFPGRNCQVQLIINSHDLKIFTASTILGLKTFSWDNSDIFFFSGYFSLGSRGSMSVNVRGEL